VIEVRRRQQQRGPATVERGLDRGGELIVLEEIDPLPAEGHGAN
jgi:hypothetical protein